MRDSTPVAFEVAGSLAVQEAAVKAGLIRLEPLAEVVVTAPESSVGAVLGELASRRAAVHGVVMESQQATVRASMPLVKTFGFVTALRSRTEGRAEASFSLAGYAPE